MNGLPIKSLYIYILHISHIEICLTLILSTKKVLFRETKAKLKNALINDPVSLPLFLFFFPVPIRAFEPDIFLPLTWTRREITVLMSGLRIWGVLSTTWRPPFPH